MPKEDLKEPEEGAVAEEGRDLERIAQENAADAAIIAQFLEREAELNRAATRAEFTPDPLDNLSPELKAKIVTMGQALLAALEDGQE